MITIIEKLIFFKQILFHLSMNPLMSRVILNHFVFEFKILKIDQSLEYVQLILKNECELGIFQKYSAKSRSIIS